MKIYTKTGDKGITGLIGGTRVPKSDLRLESYGTIDELNSFIGLLCSENMDDANRTFLLKIQEKLFQIGSYLATDQEKYSAEQFLAGVNIIDVTESEIDRMNEDLEELRSFILPGGTRAASLAHICRTVSRRAERRIIALSEIYTVDTQVIKLINRLSDYFFTLARHLNWSEGRKEISWKL